MLEVEIEVKRLPNSVGLPLPAYQTLFSSGMDLMAAIDEIIYLEPKQRVKIPCGIAIKIPEGFEGQIRSRSGMSINYGVVAINSPGTIDSDYRGEILMAVLNLGKSTFFIRRGDRLAQLVIAPVVRGRWKEVSELDSTLRGEGGLGSTGFRSEE